MAVEVVLPKVDMDMESGIIAGWKVAEGAFVRAGEILFDMETSKSIMEVEAPATGVIRGLARVDGAQLPVGTVVALIDPAADATAASPSEHATADATAASRSEHATGSAADATAQAPTDEGLRATPYARSLARTHAADLGRIRGSGPRGRIGGDDVRAHVEARESAATVDTASLLVPFTPSRRVAARRLAESTRSIPHFYLTAHLDMSALRAELARAGRALARAGGIRPTMTIVLAHLLGRVLAQHPLLNASVEGEAARLHGAVHLGIAMDRDGDLVVPVLRDAQRRSLAELTSEFRRLRDAVRSRTITPADLRGATFTLSSLEMYGVDAYTAIIDPPQSAILAVGRTLDTPVGRDGQVVLRPIATLSLSSDHRIVDGVTAARFMADLRRAIEAPAALA